MAAVCNGLAAHGGVLPYCATFLTFVGYALGAIRLSALSGFRVVYVMTHDSIGLGEDGPTHQPIETLASLRSMPNMLVVRPADGNETSGAYAVALSNAHRPPPCPLRQTLPTSRAPRRRRPQGAYTIHGPPAPRRSRSPPGRVHLCLAIAKAMGNGASSPCRAGKLFGAGAVQAERPRRQAPVVSGEPPRPGWELLHAHVGMTTFGYAPGKKCFEHFGFTEANITAKVNKAIQVFGAAPPPRLLRGLLIPPPPSGCSVWRAVRKSGGRRGEGRPARPASMYLN